MWQRLVTLQLPLKSVLSVLLATGIMVAQYTVTWKTLLCKGGLEMQRQFAPRGGQVAIAQADLQRQKPTNKIPLQTAHSENVCPRNSEFLEKRQRLCFTSHFQRHPRKSGHLLKFLLFYGVLFGAQFVSLVSSIVYYHWGSCPLPRLN